jgi:pimeloyl-ACP methyl ester carboxylesterase
MHKVQTPDGYILTVFRIPGLTGEAANANKPAVLFQHGILDSADAWIMNKAEVAPAFVVARLGYDVWLGNTRGNKYSREHIKLTTYDAAFWDFDFQTMGEGDIPGIISYIRSYHGDVKIAYIGHSQGTSQMFSELSLN